jgi:hypothetical protein
MHTQSQSNSNVNTTVHPTPDSRSWANRQYADHYETAFRLVVKNRKDGHTTRLKQLVEWVYDTDYSTTEYQRIRRFVNDCDLFEVETTAGFTRIEPTPDAFAIPLESTVSVTQKRNTATGSENYTSETTETTDTTESYPKDRVESLLDKILRINAESHCDYRSEILRQLAIYRDSIKGTYSILEHRIWQKYLSIPNTTRFTDSHDSANSERQFREGLDNASEGFDTGVVVTLTIDPKRFETHSEAIESAKHARRKLLSRLPYQVGKSLSQITIPDFQTNTGLLHYHIPLFGIHEVSESQNKTGKPTISESQIREYWSEDYDIGSQITIQPTRKRNGEWLLHSDDKKVSLSYYLGKRIRELQDLSELDGGSLPLKYWRHALFWVYGLRYVTCSNSLKDTTEDTDTGLSGLPKATEWRYIGTARYEQIPTHIRENMILVGTPP